MPTQRECPHCHHLFTPPPSRPDIRFCSLQCRRSYPAIKRLWERTDFDGPIVTEELGPCWDFPHSLVGGYGTIADDNGKVVPAHRLAYRDAYGAEALPDGVLLCHKCDRRVCVRPDHHFPGSHHDNMQDAVAKGRKPATAGTFGPGEAHRRSKLADAQATEAYALRVEGWPVAQIAARYGVNRKVISALCSGKRRQHLGLAPLPRKRINYRA